MSIYYFKTSVWSSDNSLNAMKVKISQYSYHIFVVRLFLLVNLRFMHVSHIGEHHSISALKMGRASLMWLRSAGNVH